MAANRKGKATVGSSTPEPHRILQEPPEPIAKLDMSDLYQLSTNYKAFIKNIRGAVKSQVSFNFTFQDDPTKNRSIPMTPGEDYSPDGCFSFELCDDRLRLLVVCEKHQIWFRGIVTNNGKRFEIDLDGDKTKKVMVGSVSLGTTGMYPNLLGGDTVDKCRIGYQALFAAFHTLANHTKNGSNDHKTAIAVILVMVIEAARIKELYKLSSRLLKNYQDGEVGASNKWFINNRSDICRDFYKENGDNLDVHITGLSGSATKIVANSIYILCQTPFRRWLEEKRKKESMRKLKKGGGTSSFWCK